MTLDEACGRAEVYHIDARRLAVISSTCHRHFLFVFRILFFLVVSLIYERTTRADRQREVDLKTFNHDYLSYISLV